MMNSPIHSWLVLLVAVGGIVWAGCLFIPVQGQSLGRRIGEWGGWAFFVYLYARISRVAPGTADDHARTISGIIPPFATSRSYLWIVLYVVCEFAVIPGVLVYLAVYRPDVLAITRSRLLLVSWVAVVVFFAYPVAPPWALATGLKGYGSFPSLHVAEAWIVATAVVSRRYAVLWTMVVSAVVIISRNHYPVDVIAGAVLALSACAIIRRGRASELGIVPA